MELRTKIDLLNTLCKNIFGKLKPIENSVKETIPERGNTYIRKTIWTNKTEEYKINIDLFPGNIKKQYEITVYGYTESAKLSEGETRDIVMKSDFFNIKRDRKLNENLTEEVISELIIF